MIRTFFLGALAFVCLVSAASALQLEPYKDDLFAYTGILKTGDGGDYVVVDYNEMRDINGRDQVPERRVKQNYVSLQPKRSQQDLVVTTDNGPVKVMATGKLDAGASVITIYLHGQGGNRQQGMNDFTFGGNFNRLKNLMVRNDGLYLSPDFTDFGEKGEAEVAGLISHFKSQSPQAKVFVACGSMGGSLCWRLAQDARGGQEHFWSDHSRFAMGRSFHWIAVFQTPHTGLLRPWQSRSGLWRGQAGSILPGDPGIGERISGALSSFRERQSRYANPHDRLAQHPELDAVGRAVKRSNGLLQ